MSVKVRLNTYKASAENGYHTVVFDFDPPFPFRDIEAKNTAEIVAEVNKYADEIRKTGRKVYVSAMLFRGQRAPNGFKAAKTDIFVNCD